MRKVLTLFIALTMFISCATSPVQAEMNKQISICLNQKFISLETQPYIKNGVIYVPARQLAQALGSQVVIWNSKENSLFLHSDSFILKFYLDDHQAYLNGVLKTFKAYPEIINGKTMMPVQILSDLLGFQVTWEESTQSLNLTKQDYVLDSSLISKKAYTKEDIIWLSRIVMAETQGASFEAKLAVANVVLNRVKSHIYPNSIKEVIYQSGGNVQFPPAHAPEFTTRVPNTDSITAAKMALEGVNNISDCLYFNNAPFVSKSKDYYATIDGVYFYR